MRLNKYAIELVPTEDSSCKKYLRGMRDEIRTQLVALKIREFTNLSEQEKIVEQSLGLRKKVEPSRVMGKRFGTPNSNSILKKSIGYRNFGKTVAKSAASNRIQDRQPIVSKVLTCEHCVLDCQKEKFSVQDSNNETIKVSGIKASGLTQIVSLIQADKLLRQGCKDFLDYVVNSKLRDSEISDTKFVCEFPEVFPKELLGLPPD
ncbi:gag protease polyprotein [Gossypium australe]|uniref:Gag protease polyprotein n=1 Tax=Gossypium australe TaxID=47621 RepID=A0A5B6VMQ3_9ROSI|nr:gag protease polyprotein [Gossypium australe]